MMRALKSWLVGLAACLLALAPSVWAAQAKAGLALEAGFTPTQDLPVWPLQSAHGYPLVRAQVGEVQGVFMLDTGTPWGLLLNSARVKLPDATPVVSGSAGSGQKLEISRSSHMPPIQIHGQNWAQVRDVHSADLAFIEQGTGMGPYLGFIGANFFKDSALTLDYARRVAFVQRLHPDNGTPLAALPAAQSGGTTVASLHYRGAQPNTPVLDAMLSNTAVRVMLDSGNPGANIDRAWLATLQAAGSATPFSQMDGNTTYRISPLLLGGAALALEDIARYEVPVMINGQPDPQLVKIGYSLLKHLGVTWNYRLQTMTFFMP